MFRVLRRRYQIANRWEDLRMSLIYPCQLRAPNSLDDLVEPRLAQNLAARLAERVPFNYPETIKRVQV